MVELPGLASFANPARVLVTEFFEAISIVVYVFVTSDCQLRDKEREVLNVW